VNSEIKKVLHVGHSLAPGGITSFMASVFDLNTESSSKHDLLTFNQIDKSIKVNCQKFTLRQRSLFAQIKFFWRLQKEYDSICMHAIHPTVIFPLIFSRKQVLLFQHGMTVNQGSFLKRKLKCIWYSLVPYLTNSRVICSTKFARLKLKINKIRIGDAKIEIIPFGIDLRSKKNPLTVVADSKKVLRLGLAGKLVTQKRFDLVLDALESYSSNVKLEVLIAGEGPEKAILELKAASIANSIIKVEFLGQVECMDSFYQSVDLFVLPSMGESQGLVVSEAFKNKTPVLVFKDVGGCREFITPDKNGFVLEDKSEFAPLLEKIAENRSVLTELKDFLQEMDMSEFDIKLTRSRLEQFAV